MKFLYLLVLGSVVLLGGCASAGHGDQAATGTDRETYVSLGSSIPKKKGSQDEGRKIDLQQLENERMMNSATINKP